METLQVVMKSFGFRTGVPKDAMLTLDVRSLRNPYYVPQLQPLCGLDEPVRAYILDDAATQRYLCAARELVLLTLRGAAARKMESYTIAIGCTGGQHRSVALTEILAEYCRAEGYPVRTEHSCLEKRDRTGGN